MTPLFIDAGYLIALEASDDQHHDGAVRHWRGLLQSPPPLVTTSYVFDEVVTFFNSRNRHAKAVEVGESLLQESFGRVRARRRAALRGGLAALPHAR
jgi:predicted nucleic acid-binding protein